MKQAPLVPPQKRWGGASVGGVANPMSFSCASSTKPNYLNDVPRYDQRT